MAPEVRRPRRAAKPNKKYVVDPFHDIKDLLIESSDSASDTSTANDNPSSDDEFDETKVVEEEGAIADEEILESDPEPAAGNDAEESEEDVVGAAQEVEDDDIIQVNYNPKPKSAAPRPVGPLIKKRRDDVSVYTTFPIFDPLGTTGAKGRMIHYTRGIPELAHHQSKDYRLLFNLGPGNEDLVAHIQARGRWLNDITLPHREFHKGAAGGGLAYSTFYLPAKREKEGSTDMDWYYEQGGQKAFAEIEVARLTKADEIPDKHATTARIVAGPVDSPKLVDGIKPHNSWNLGEAFADTRNPAGHQTWIINAGSTVQALEWAPNRSGSSQFLAVATVPNRSPNASDESNTEAYSTKNSLVEGLQIWEFAALDSETGVGSKIDFSKTPVLRMVISSNWGPIRRLKWCPTADGTEEGEDGDVRLGLLASVWGDGRLRVMDLFLPATRDTARIYMERAPFEAQPPDTICTCLTWLSSKNIAAGTAHGSVAIWNIVETVLDPKSKSKANSNKSPRPWFYQVIHQSYLHSIESGYPSRPHMLFTFSVDGYTRATDLRAPGQDMTTSTRSRIAQGPVIWHDIIQSAITVDDNFTMKSYSLRLFYRAVSVGRFTAFAGDIASSPLHASVLVACVDGCVYAINPMRRLRDHKLRSWVHCVLKHEWRRPVVSASKGPTKEKEIAEDGDVEMPDASAGAEEGDEEITEPAKPNILTEPLIRIMMGFKLTRPDLSQAERNNTTDDSVSFATVYEEKTAITQVAWNPNLRAGTWAAMGTNGGLVIVKDLGLD